MIAGEMIIYIRLCYVLWNHDEGMKDKISSDDLRQRKRKNVISLSGQVIAFFVESLFPLLVIARSQNLIDVSIFPILFITSTSIISIAQLWTSHELKRYIKSKFMDCSF